VAIERRRFEPPGPEDGVLQAAQATDTASAHVANNLSVGILHTILAWREEVV
jgi:hypothetical protein